MSIQQTTAKITLDLYTKNVVSVNAKQYDNQTRYIEISCVENGIVFTVDKSIMSAFIRFKKPDDNGVFNEVEITSDGKLKIELTEQMLSASGRAIADVFLLRKVFTSNEKPTNIDDIYKINAPIISIMDFYINITPTALNHSQIESSYEFNALTNALAQIDFNNKKVVELDKTLTTNEDIRKQNETERKSNEESRINSEQKRVNEEDKRQKAEDIRVANENTRISNENTRQAQETKRQTDTAAAITNANAAAKNANDKANDLQIATQAEIDKIHNIENSIQNIDSEWFEYNELHKKHVLKIDVSFPIGQSEITHIPLEKREELYSAGLAIDQFLKHAEEEYGESVKYLLIIEGQASNDGYTGNFDLSYQRALSLYRYFQINRHLDLKRQNCEVLVCGSGTEGALRAYPDNASNTKNQRFLIHILPKPGVIN